MFYGKIDIGSSVEGSIERSSPNLELLVNIFRINLVSVEELIMFETAESAIVETFKSLNQIFWSESVRRYYIK